MPGTTLLDSTEAILFEQDTFILAYALYKLENEYIYLRQFFVSRDQRRRRLRRLRADRRRGSGRRRFRQVGRQAMLLLILEIWPAHLPVRLELLVDNEVARRFWKALGFSDYAVTMELERIN